MENSEWITLNKKISLKTIYRNLKVSLDPPMYGIYFLFYKETLVYIGRTKDLHQRLKSHHIPRTQYTRVCFLDLHGSLWEDIHVLERHFIKKFKPQENIQGTPKEGQHIREKRGTRVYYA